MQEFSGASYPFTPIHQRPPLAWFLDHPTLLSTPKIQAIDLVQEAPFTTTPVTGMRKRVRRAFQVLKL
tara:strand:- start:190 stop:393 length:204 start_codon:yes stop_codon:yes gene_type:complete